MTKIRDYPNDKLLFTEGSAPLTPSSGQVQIYAKAGGQLYSQDDAGAETPLGGGGAGTVDSVVAGTGISVDATDPANPIANLDSSSIASLDLADSAIQSVVAGANVTVDNTDPQNPTVSASGGGGGLTDWTEAVNTSTPNATIPVVSLTANNAATNVDAAICPKGSGALLVDIPDNTSAGGNKRGNGAVDLQGARGSADQVASGAAAVIVGGRNNRASGAYSVALGDGSVASGNYSCAIGGSNTAASQGGLCFGGINNAVSGDYACTTGGSSLNADGDYSRAGGFEADARARFGVDVYASGKFSAVGDAQSSGYILRRNTSSATPAIISTNNAGATAAGQILLPNSAAYIVRGDIIARENATGDCKSWEWRATVKRGANAASTAIVGSAVVTVCDADTGAAAWTIAIGVDTTYGALAVTVTGEASKSIKWVSNARSVEVVG